MAEKKNLPIFYIDPKDKATKRVIAPYLKIIRKGKKPKEEVGEYKRLTYFLDRKPEDLIRDLTLFLSENVDFPALLYDTALMIKTVTKATGMSLYMVDSGFEEIYLIESTPVNPRHKVNWKIQEGTVVSAYVAHKKEYIMQDSLLGDDRFPSGIGFQDETVQAVLCVPVVTPQDECIAVIEMYKDTYEEPFNKDDLKLTVIITGWMAAAIAHNRDRVKLLQQQQVNDILLELTKCYFAHTVPLAEIITEIVIFAKNTMQAERGMFYVIDQDSPDLQAEVYDQGISDVNMLHKKNIKVKLTKDPNTAGLVARSKAPVNVKDAYNDPRFSFDIDERTGFITRSVLCIPILGITGILGVFQIINKKHGVGFNQNDEDVLKTFSTYCTLILHFANLKKKMHNTKLLIDSTEGLLSFQLRPCSHDRDKLADNASVPISSEFFEFKWYISPEETDLMPQYTLFMLTEVIGHHNVRMDNLITFILTVRKTYRHIPYHNFEHAFNVTHCMFNIVQRNSEQFSEIETISFVLACFCHDLDHGGYTQNYLQIINDTWTQLYDESPLESHHYEVAVRILNNIDIFVRMSPENYKEMLDYMKDMILATDLSNYFKYRMRLSNVTEIDLTNARHRFYIRGIMMSSCDLSGSCKPYPIAKRLIDNLYMEFYNQGDKEKLLGLTPLSLMDRDKNENIPEDQIQFINVIVLPCVELLRTVFPNTDELFDLALTLKKTWLDIIELRGQKSWRPDDSYSKKKPSL